MTTMTLPGNHAPIETPVHPERIERSTNGQKPARPRRHDLDWLRVIAILLLLFFHAGMPFVAEWDWHIKNAETSYIFQEWMFFLSRWRMALLFLISGIGTYFALGFRSPGRYVTERFKRLIVPLVFGILVIVPPQIYMERLFQGQTFSSYLEFWPTVLDFKPYPEGNTSYHHLWFVAYLFIYSLLALPLFLYLRRPAGRRLVDRLARYADGIGLYTFALPLAAVYAGLIVRFPGPQDFVHDWAMFTYYLLFFVFGYVIGTHEGFWAAIENNRKRSLQYGFVLILLIDYLRWNDLTEWGYNPGNMLLHALMAVNAWCWVMALLGYGKHYLNRESRLLKTASEGIYPFYILHQTVIVVLAFYVVQVQESILSKFLFTSLASLVVTIGLYEFFVRPYPAMRFLFGMKPKQESPKN